MDERLKSNQEFQYVLDDVTRLKEQIAKNTLSLNEADRLTEIHNNKQRNKQRSAERKDRIASANKNGDPYTVYRLNLENADADHQISCIAVNHQSTRWRKQWQKAASNSILVWPTNSAVP